MAGWGESRPKAYVCYLCGAQYGSSTCGRGAVARARRDRGLEDGKLMVAGAFDYSKHVWLQRVAATVASNRVPAWC